MVLVSDHRYPYEQGETVAWISTDRGQSWPDKKYHLSAGADYPASIALADGTLVTVTGNTRLDPAAKPLEPWSVQAIPWKP